MEGTVMVMVNVYRVLTKYIYILYIYIYVYIDMSGMMWSRDTPQNVYPVAVLSLSDI